VTDSLGIGSRGPYPLKRLVGSGGMGSVFEAEDTVLQRPVALKPAARSSGSRSRRALRATASAILTHRRQRGRECNGQLTDRVVAVYDARSGSIQRTLEHRGARA
jgi:serine/threonine protein kinase